MAEKGKVLSYKNSVPIQGDTTKTTRGHEDTSWERSLQCGPYQLDLTQ